MALSVLEHRKGRRPETCKSVMKNTIRVRRNGATSPANSQRKTAAGTKAEFEMPKIDTHPSCLAIYDRLGKGLVSKIPLAETEFENLLITANTPDARGHKPGTENLVADAIREKLARDSSQAFDALTELELAKFQSNALMQLMLESEAGHLINGDLGDKERDCMNAGVAQLVRFTKARLEKSFDAVFTSIHPKREAAHN
jgi:hypothetical protein